MYSRLLTTLNAEAKNTTNPENWAKAICRSAVHFSRKGHTGKALEAVALVRGRFSHSLTPTIAAWLMLAEGILEFFREDSSAAFDRARRAHAIAVAADLADVRPTCSAWMALLEFNALRYEQMVLHIDDALSRAQQDDHQALARASLVLADALHFTGNFAIARPWYEKTRLHATAEGDEATLSAMLHNVAAFRVDNVRIADAFGISMPQEAQRAMMEANSALNYDTALGSSSFSMLVPLYRAQLLMVERNYVEAERMLELIDRSELEEKSVPLLIVDTAWSKIAQGKSAAGSALAAEAEALLESVTHIDERAYVSAKLASIAEALGDSERAMQLRQVAADALHEHRETQAKLLGRLEGLLQRHSA